MRRRRVAGLVAAGLLVIVGCGTEQRSGGSSRGVKTVVSCLRSHHVDATTFAMHVIRTRGLPAPQGLIFVNRGVLNGGDIAIYRDPGSAAEAFTHHGVDIPELVRKNVIIEFPQFAPPANSTTIGALERCAFGSPSGVRESQYYVASTKHTLTGNQVMAGSGCLACHKIGDAGNDGPGADLSRIGTHLSSSKIATALVRPTAPMPSYAALEKSHPRSWRALISYLSQLGRSDRQALVAH